jgi:hypothetical protein
MPMLQGQGQHTKRMESHCWTGKYRRAGHEIIMSSAPPPHARARGVSRHITPAMLNQRLAV